MTSEQLRAGRALIKWSAEDLAKHSGVGVATIRRLEASFGTPSSNARTLEQLKRSLSQPVLNSSEPPNQAPVSGFGKTPSMLRSSSLTFD